DRRCENNLRLSPAGDGKAVMNTLGLIGDGDEYELIRTIERVFAITFTDADYAGFRTVGDIESAVWRYLQAKKLGQNRCATALAFYELRRALKAAGLRHKIRPSTDLNTLFNRPSALTALVKKHCNLSLRFAASGLAAIGGYSVLIAVILIMP